MPCGWSLFPLFLNTIKICLRGINIKRGHRGTRQPQRTPCHGPAMGRTSAGQGSRWQRRCLAHPGKQLSRSARPAQPPRHFSLAPRLSPGPGPAVQLGPGSAPEPLNRAHRLGVAARRGGPEPRERGQSSPRTACAACLGWGRARAGAERGPQGSPKPIL